MKRDTVEVAKGSISINPETGRLEGSGLDSLKRAMEDRPVFKFHWETADLKLVGEGENPGDIRAFVKAGDEWVPLKSVTGFDLRLRADDIVPEFRLHLVGALPIDDA
jgi:hypothetical protein